MREAHAAVEAVAGARVLVAELPDEHRVVAHAVGSACRVHLATETEVQSIEHPSYVMIQICA